MVEIAENVDKLRNIRGYLKEKTSFTLSKIKHWEMEGVDNMNWSFTIKKGVFGKKFAAIEFNSNLGKVTSNLTLVLLNDPKFEFYVEELQKTLKEFDLHTRKTAQVV